MLPTDTDSVYLCNTPDERHNIMVKHPPNVHQIPRAVQHLIYRPNILFWLPQMKKNFVIPL